MAVDPAYIKNLIDENIKSAPPAPSRSNTAATVRALLKMLVDWVTGNDYTPEHNWNGTQLRFTRADGTPGNYVELRGPQGIKGDTGAKGDAGTLTASVLPARTTPINRTSEKVVVQRADGLLEKVNLYQMAGGFPLSTGNLVTNGNGELGDVSNMKPDNPAFLVFDATQTSIAGGMGAFKWIGSAGAVTIQDMISINLLRRHRISVVARTGNANGTNYDANARTYFGVVCLDADGNLITPNHFAKVSGSALTTLAVALNPGATAITLTSAAGWNSGASAQFRGIAWYPYVNALGQVYPDYGYSRNVVSNAWGNGGIAGNVITLSTPWAGPALAAGTKVANLQDGGTYLYSSVLNNALVPNAWTSYEVYIQGVNAGSTEDGGNMQFRPGTAYIRPLLLINYNAPAAGTTFYFSMLDVREAVAPFDPVSLLGGTNTFTGPNTFSGDVTLKRIIASGSTPTVAVNAVTSTGAGSGATASMVAGSTDLAGTLTLVTGTGTIGTNVLMTTITFATALAAAPKAVVVTARNNQTAMSLGRFFINTKTLTGFTIHSTDVSPGASTTFLFDYIVIA